MPAKVVPMPVDPDDSVVCGICAEYVCAHSHKQAVYCLAEAFAVEADKEAQ